MKSSCVCVQICKAHSGSISGRVFCWGPLDCSLPLLGDPGKPYLDEKNKLQDGFQASLLTLMHRSWRPHFKCMHAQVHVASFGTFSRNSTTTALNQWVADAVALVPLLVMLILRTGA